MPRIIGLLLVISLILACGPTEPEDGTLVVSIQVRGIDIQTEHTVTIDEMPPKAIPVDGSRELVVPAGEHVVRIHGVAANCVSSLPVVQPVSIQGGETSHLDYSIVCTPITGFVRVLTMTNGEDIDPDGYLAYTTHSDDWFGGDGIARMVSSNGEAVLGPTSVGQHKLFLDDLADNCKVTGKNPVPITVPQGQFVRDTVTVSMEITCTAITP